VDLEAKYRGLLEILFLHLLAESEENDEMCVRITGVQAQVHIKHFQNMSVERYRHANLFGKTAVIISPFHSEAHI
jgi:hypothetical protein